MTFKQRVGKGEREMKCSAYKNGVKCQKQASHVSTVPGLDKKLEKHLLCNDCANERMRIKDYPWSIKRIKR